MSAADATTPTRDEVADLVVSGIQAMGAGDLDTLRRVMHPDALNREAVAEPLAARGRGPAASYATSMWLRAAFADIEFVVEEVCVDGELAVTYGTMSGRHTGDFIVYAADGSVERVFVPTGKSFRVGHAHFHRIRSGLVVEHWAVRDDNGLAAQLGWVLPSPGFLLRCILATATARRRVRRNR